MVGDPGIDELVADLSASIGLLVRRLRQRKADGELSMPESTCLSRLDREGPATSSALAKQEQISPQSMGATLAGLQERGLVERQPDPGDGRKVVMSLTPLGGVRWNSGGPPAPTPWPRAWRPASPPPSWQAARRRPVDRTTGSAHLMAVVEEDPSAKVDDNYRWVALANTTAAVFMSTLDGSIVIIALPAIFRGIHLDPLAPGNIVYLLWMIMGYRLVQAVTVVTFGRLGDMFGRVKIYNAGFVVFTISSSSCRSCPFLGVAGAQWLIGWRLVQALGGSMLTANSVAILTDAFPSRQRGFALGLNQVAAPGRHVRRSGGRRAVGRRQLALGLLGQRPGRGVRHAVGLLEAPRISDRQGGRIDWWGNITFAFGLGAILVGVTYGIQPYGHHAQGWTSPAVRRAPRRRRASCWRLRGDRDQGGRSAVPAQPVPDPRLHRRQHRRVRGVRGPRWPPVRAHHLAAGHLVSAARILLQPDAVVGRHLPAPAHGGLPDFGPLGRHSVGPLRFPRHGHRGTVVFGASFIGLLLLPVDFSYWAFALLITAGGIGSGMFAAPNTSSIMSSVPARLRGAASGMRATFQNSGTALSIGIFFSLMIAGLTGTLSTTLTSGLHQHGVPQSGGPPRGFAAAGGLPVRCSCSASIRSSICSRPAARCPPCRRKPEHPHRPHLLPAADLRALPPGAHVVFAFCGRPVR